MSNWRHQIYSDNKDKAKVGRVTVLRHRGAYRVRFTYPKGKRHDLKIANADDTEWNIASRAATLIDLDISNYSAANPGFFPSFLLGSNE